ncbi:Na(+)/H(+) antiporter subunit C [Nesterenkonia sp. E16_7]|uniref:Na(+)/H(+) antiporter subunit C n=1 Tax=unclassified Nesterenkonia TaxID=2629769 RepID=UPI001A935A9D|nr:Na(+)/H(+) antiporter subunit C [Nesterenkonia sp. E16_10]MBO0598055.1 Na(+)/H(+) antiporter subunit C [Nesterenkonia sp. E16_7]
MTVNLTLLVLMGALFAIGIYLLLERSLTRVLLGIILISNGVNLLLLHTAGRAGLAPIYSPEVGAEEYLDPLPQALLLTAIVIAFALVSFMLALIYRSWVLARQDELADDEEDRRVASYAKVHDTEEDAELATETTEFADDTDSAGRQLLNPRRGSDAVDQAGAVDETDAVRGTGDVEAAHEAWSENDAPPGGEMHPDQLDVTHGAGRVDGPPRQAPTDPDADPSEDPDPRDGPDPTEGGQR